MTEQASPIDDADVGEVDPEEALDRLLHDLRSRREGLSDREAARRLVSAGPNELVRRQGGGWPSQLARQLVHPLALLLWMAAVLAEIDGTSPLAIAIVIVILVNALFAFFQERHAEKAVEALSAYLPQQARVVRERVKKLIDARELVPGDVIIVAEGDRVSADARLLSGSVEMDVSTLTGESFPVLRTAIPGETRGPLLEARDLLLSGTSCTEGEATAVVFATGMRTELGRIAALSQRVGHVESPLETQVKHVARLIALVAVGMGVAFIPLGTLLAGLSLGETLNFTIGLLVANVPEGLLPTITLALAGGVRLLAHEGAVIKRLSAVETLGSTSVICTDKTGTLTLNRMRVVRVWSAGQVLDINEATCHRPVDSPAERRLAAAVVACNNAEINPDGREIGDPTELALLHLASTLGACRDSGRSNNDRALLSKLDNAVSDLLVDRYATLRQKAVRLLEQLNRDRSVSYEPSSPEEFQARVIKWEPQLGDPESAGDRLLAEFLLPKIVEDSTDLSVLKEISVWIEERFGG